MTSLPQGSAASLASYIRSVLKYDDEDAARKEEVVAELFRDGRAEVALDKDGSLVR